MGCGGSKPAGAAAAGASKSKSPSEPGTDKTSSSITQAMAKVHSGKENSSQSVGDVYSGVPLSGRGDKEGECMGSGGTASVYKVVQKTTGKEFALKVVSLSQLDTQAKELLLKEIGLIKMMDHPNVVKVFEVFQTVSVLYIVMELCTGGELFDKLYDQVDEQGNETAKFSEADAHHLVKRMIGSLAYLHTNGIVHRDLKLENFIFTDTTKQAEIKLIDFGFSKKTGAEDYMRESIGTCYYMAPELLAQHYTQTVDMWSVGVVIFMMLTGRVPFQGAGGNDGNEAIIAEIKKQTLESDLKTLKKETPQMHARLQSIMSRAGPERDQKQKRNASGVMETKGKPTSLSTECINFVLGLLTVDVDKRLTAAQALQADWMTMDVSKIRGRRQTMGVDDTTEEEVEENNANLVTNLRKFRDNSKLKRSALMAVSFNLTSIELKQLAKQFSEMDANSDGIITMAEFTAQMGKLGMNTVEIQEAFIAIDQDQTGVIKYSEFIAAAIDEKEFDEDHEVEAAFRRLDLDESGELDVDDLRQLLPKGLSKDAIQRILDQADFEKDGKIDLSEFKMIMQGKIANL